jgi:hypothetical protein
MPRKKRQTYDDKRKNVIAKLIFVSVLLALVLLANIVMSLRPNSGKSSSNANKEAQNTTDANLNEPEVLGDHIINEDEIANNVGKTIDTVKEQAQNTQGKLKGVSEKAIESGKKQAEKTISTFVYDSTLKPIIEKIDDLPDEQQDMIKEAVCK